MIFIKQKADDDTEKIMVIPMLPYSVRVADGASPIGCLQMTQSVHTYMLVKK